LSLGLLFQESGDEFGNPSDDDQKTVWLYSVVQPEGLSICDTVRMQERGDRSSRWWTIKNFG